MTVIEELDHADIIVREKMVAKINELVGKVNDLVEVVQYLGKDVFPPIELEPKRD